MERKASELLTANAASANTDQAVRRGAFTDRRKKQPQPSVTAVAGGGGAEL